MCVLPGKCHFNPPEIGAVSFDTSNFFRVMLRVRSFFFLEITPFPVSSRSSTSCSGKNFFLLGRLAGPASCLFKMIINQILLGKFAFHWVWRKGQMALPFYSPRDLLFYFVGPLLVSSLHLLLEGALQFSQDEKALKARSFFSSSKSFCS